MTFKLMYIKTIGCQMNIYDSQQVVGVLSSLGYSLTEHIDDADLVLLNTCTIRQKAEQKAFSFLGKIRKLKIKNPSMIIGVGGCLAQQYSASILKKMPHVDLVFGTSALPRLPKLVAYIESSRTRIVDVDFSGWDGGSNVVDKNSYSGRISSFVSIMRGCENYCTYCVVPYVRGNEVSRPSCDIITEIEAMVSLGVREVVLLGQNVNSYGKKTGEMSFVDLLEKINKIDGLRRIRYITSHPKDLSQDLIDSFSSIDKLCSHLHLPIQSGDNRILKSMNRGYTREEYLEKISKLRSVCPGIAITSDFIVGFPGESDFQFQVTLDFVEFVKFDKLFVFSYSDRPMAPASKFKNKISEEIKYNRLLTILEIQDAIALEKNSLLVNKVQEVLVESTTSFNFDNENTSSCFNSGTCGFIGRTSGNKLVRFYGRNNTTKSSLKGKVVDVRITGAQSRSLLGEMV